jgi:predicted dehydrogenase
VLGRDAAKCDAFATQYGAPVRYASVDELARDADVDAVIIAWPNALHAPVAEAMMRAGKHVLVEKPMAMNEAEARSMAAVARDTQRQLMVGHMWRFDREAQALREVVASGALGEIVKTKGYGIHTHWGPEGWFTQPELAGGGALIDMGVHAIDTVRYLLGDPEPVRVFARLGTRFGDYQVDDDGILLIEWSTGTTSLIESGWWHPHADGVEASTQLFGTRGYGRLFPTSWSHGPEDALVSEAPAFPARDEHCDQHIYDGQVVAFAERIRDGALVIPGPEDGRIVMAICDAAYHSSKLGQAVTL